MKENKKQMSGKKGGATLILLIGVLIIVVFLGYQGMKDRQAQEEVTFEKYGKFMWPEEVQCYELCDGKYFYVESSLLNSGTCTCGVSE